MRWRSNIYVEGNTCIYEKTSLYPQRIADSPGPFLPSIKHPRKSLKIMNYFSMIMIYLFIMILPCNYLFRLLRWIIGQFVQEVICLRVGVGSVGGPSCQFVGVIFTTRPNSYRLVRNLHTLDQFPGLGFPKALSTSEQYAAAEAELLAARRRTGDGLGPAI